MKNFKKIIVLVIIFMGATFFIIYKIKTNTEYEEFEYENIYNEQVFDEEIEETEEEKNYIILHITGEIANPGIIKIEEGSRVIDAIDAAGGLTEKADVNKINLAYIVSDGQKIYIPSIEDTEENEYISQNIGNNFLDEQNNNKININTATQTELETLNGIGPSTALKIINYRKENGKFNNIEEIKNVPGIGESKFKQIENQICV